MQEEQDAIQQKNVTSKSNSSITLLIVLFIFIALSGAWYLLSDSLFRKSSTMPTEEMTEEEVDPQQYGIEFVGQNDFLLGKQEITDSNIPAPDIQRPLTLPQNLSTEMKEKLRERVIDAENAVKENPASVSAWLDLAIARKGIDDFGGAEEIWIYLNTLFPDQTIARINLANLYYLEFNRDVEAEALLLQSLALNPNADRAYRGLFEIYYYKMKQPAKAEAILLKAITHFEGHPDYMSLLAGMYREVGRIEDARAMYRKAALAASALGNIDLAHTYQNAADALPQSQ
jgi:hypothetical protein